MASIDGGNIQVQQNPAGPGVPQPAWSGAGGGAGAAAVYAWQALYNQLGYAPTAAQLAQAAPSFMGTDPNIANVSGGDQFVSQMVQQLNAQSPQGAQSTATSAADQTNQNVAQQYSQLMPTLQSQYLDPLNQAIQQQSGTQQNLANQTMGQQQGLTNQALGQSQGLTMQSLMGQMGLNQQAMGQQQGINNQALGQQQGLENQYISGLQNTDQAQMQDLVSQLGPNGQLGQQLAGEYANYGLTPNSGGFQEGISNTLGNLSMQEQQQIASALGTGYGQVSGSAQTGTNALSGLNSQGSSALTGILGQGQQNAQGVENTGLNSLLGTSGANYTTQSNLGLGGLSATQSALQQPLTQGLNQTAVQQGQQNSLQNLLTNQGFAQNDFNQQSTLAQLLAQQGSPSGLQSALGMASGGAQGAGSLLQGGASAYKATWICSQLKKEGLMTDANIKALHDHLYKAFWKRPMKFIGYLLFGRFLVYLANKYNTDWRVWKSEFYDDVMAEPDPVRAADLYADTFWKLYLNVTAKEYARKGMVG